MNTTQQTTLNFLQEDYLLIWLDAFLKERASRKLAKGTVHYYQEKIQPFVDFCEGQAVTQISQITPMLIREYLLFLEARGNNPGGIHGHYRSLKAWLRWFWEETEPDYPNPINKVHAPKVPEKQLEPVDYQDVLAMRDACGNALIGRRDKAILYVLPDVGVRASELLGMLLQDVDIFSGQIFVRKTKGGVPRNVYCGSNSLRNLRRYLKVRKDNSPALWITPDARSLTYWGLVEVMRRRSEQAHVPQPSLHGFRRWWAVNFLRSGGQVFELQRAGGWKSLQAMRPYIKLNENDIQQAMREHSPVDHMK